MNHGEWIGSNIHESNRMLILGESHYGDENGTNESMGKPVPYTTEGVVRAYKEHKIPGNSKARWDKFFDQMAACFGYPKGKGGDFYDEVFFGNYVPILCGIAKENRAEHYMKANRTEYNNQLFEFINNHGIDTVVCFSIATFWNLPATADSDRDTYNEIELPLIGGRRNIVYYYSYSPFVSHGYCDINLEKPLKVYGIRHPSAQGGFNAEAVYEVFSHVDDLMTYIYAGG